MTTDKKAYLCEECGIGVAIYRKTCDTCNDKRLFSEAEKLIPEQYSGWVYREYYGHNNGYFESIDELIEWCEDGEIKLPEWVFCCKGERHLLDIDSAIESMLDEAYEDARYDLKDEKELYDFVEKWNAKQNIISYYPDYKRVVVLKGETA